MNEELKLVEEFHKKFKVPILNSPSLISKDRSEFRYNLMKEEVDEYLEGTQKEDIENIAKELADQLYALYGTILEHGLQDKMPEILKEVHNSHMTKEFREFKMVKGKDFKEANIKKLF